MYEDYLKRFDSLLPDTPQKPAARSDAVAVPADPGIATPAAPRQSPAIRRIVAEARMDFHAVRDRHGSMLSQVNAELGQVDCGPLVAVAISATARQPGPLAEFLLDVGLNPFGDWNMLYYASDKPSADLMDALLFSPGTEKQFDAGFTAIIEAARDTWLRFHEEADAENETAVRDLRETLRRSLMMEGETVKSAVYGERANRWRNLFPKPAN